MSKRYWMWIFVCLLMIMIIVMGWYLLTRQSTPEGGILVQRAMGAWKNG